MTQILFNLKKMLESSIVLFALILTGLLASSCGSVKKDFETSRDLPAAKGTVKASPADNNNTKVKVEVDYLAPAEKVVPGATTYVVWVKPTEGASTHAQNVGQLKVDDDLEGKLETVTSLKNFSVFVTAEASPQALQPSGEPLLWSNVEM